MGRVKEVFSSERDGFFLHLDFDSSHIQCVNSLESLYFPSGGIFEMCISGCDFSEHESYSH